MALQAGLLTRVLSESGRLPGDVIRITSSGSPTGTSALTVAGAVTDLHRFPFSSGSFLFVRFANSKTERPGHLVSLGLQYNHQVKKVNIYGQNPAGHFVRPAVLEERTPKGLGLEHQ
jgi:hypothetical protein